MCKKIPKQSKKIYHNNGRIKIVERHQRHHQKQQRKHTPNEIFIRQLAPVISNVLIMEPFEIFSSFC